MKKINKNMGPSTRIERREVKNKRETTSYIDGRRRVFLLGGRRCRAVISAVIRVAVLAALLIKRKIWG